MARLTVYDSTYYSLMPQAFDIHVEVLDTRSGTVLATLGPWPLERAERELIVHFFPGTWTGHKAKTETVDGLPEVRMAELRLVARQVPSIR